MSLQVAFVPGMRIIYCEYDVHHTWTLFVAGFLEEDPGTIPKCIIDSRRKLMGYRRKLFVRCYLCGDIAVGRSKIAQICLMDESLNPPMSMVDAR